MADGEVSITVSESGPYRVEAGMELRDANGDPIETRDGKAFFLCRCGQSSNKPFCDGTHNSIEWDASLASTE